MSDLKELVDKYSSQVRLVSANDKVYKDECVFSYVNPFSPDGLYVCLNRFIGVSKDLLPLYFSKSQSNLYLKIKSLRREIPEEENNGEPEKKINKFGIGIEGGFSGEQNYTIEHEYYLYVYPEDREVRLNEATMEHEALNERVVKSIASVVKAESNLLREELAAMTTAWDGEKRFVSKHSANLIQLPNPIQISPNPNNWKCNLCDINKNLWMNLTDGTILCGRKQLDGSGGNNHAVEYYEKTKYPLAVKLGTINASGADVYSYDEDDMVEDANLAVHLAHFGINMSKMEKTDKTMAEMEIDLNQKVGEWDRIQESGSKLVPLYGPGYTGMQNLGNSCYMNSVMQVLFTIPDFVEKYASELNRSEYLQRAPFDPSNDFNFQMSKLANGLLSGQYSNKPLDEKIKKPKGIKPNSFKYLVGRGHPEFSTKRQQDAHEYLMHLVNLYDQNSRTDLVKSSNPFESFKFKIEERIECAQSNHVKYTYRDEFCLPLPISRDLAVNKEQVKEFQARKVSLEAEGKKLEPGDIVRPEINLVDCLNLFIQEESIADFYSSATKAKGVAIKSSKMATFPDFLFIQARKFELGPDWAPVKVDVSLQVPDELDMSQFRGEGKKETEVELTEDDANMPATAEIHLNENVISQLMDMGFSMEGARRAAYHTRDNNDPEAAVNWCMAHMEDGDFNSPFVIPNQGKKNNTPKAACSEEGIMMLTSMGFNRAQAIKALEETNNNIERAADWIFSHTDEIMDLDENTPHTNALETTAAPTYRDGAGQYKLVAFISHMGSNANVGHYVAHILKDNRWCIFNDENVALSENPPKDLAYLYLYRRV